MSVVNPECGGGKVLGLECEWQGDKSRGGCFCLCVSPASVPRYLHGLGLEKNLPIAFDLLQKAAEVGNPEALYNLGMMYLSVSPSKTKRLAPYLHRARGGGGGGMRNTCVSSLQIKHVACLAPPNLHFVCICFFAPLVWTG